MICIKAETINKLLDIKESYQAPQRMLELLLDDDKRPKLFDDFLKHESDLSYEWFQSYFEDEHSERKAKKQDFTPTGVSHLLARLTEDSSSYFECAAGTGGIMIQYWNQNKDADCWYRLEELSERSIPFLLFNMSIRGMRGIVLRGDSLENDFKEIYKVDNDGKYSKVYQVEKYETEREFSTVLMNPPFSAKWSADKKFLEDDRFKEYERLAPKAKADYAFLLHGFDKLEENGTMAIVLPHGVLFRGNAENKIRKRLLESGMISAVIGLPSDLFRNTSIPTTVIVLRKNRVNENVLFIDASRDFEKERSRNLLSEDNIKKIIDTYKARKNVDKYAHLATFEEIKENDFNLNIPRFVDTFEEEEPIDLIAVSEEILSLKQQINDSEQELLSMLNELQVTDESREIIEATKRAFGSNVYSPKQMKLFKE